MKIYELFLSYMFRDNYAIIGPKFRPLKTIRHPINIC